MSSSSIDGDQMRNHGRPKCCLPRRGFLKPANTNVPAEHARKSRRKRMLDRLRELFSRSSPYFCRWRRRSYLRCNDLHVRKSEGSDAKMIESTNSMTPMLNERTVRRALIIIALRRLPPDLPPLSRDTTGLRGGYGRQAQFLWSRVSRSRSLATFWREEWASMRSRSYRWPPR